MKFFFVVFGFGFKNLIHLLNICEELANSTQYSTSDDSIDTKFTEFSDAKSRSTYLRVTREVS